MSIRRLGWGLAGDDDSHMTVCLAAQIGYHVSPNQQVPTILCHVIIVDMTDGAVNSIRRIRHLTLIACHVIADSLLVKDPLSARLQ